MLDASWSDARRRRAAGRLAEGTHSCLARLVCEAPAETSGRRLATRPRTASDATASVAAAMAQTADPWPEAVRVPTDRPFAESLDLAGAVWRAALSGRQSHGVGPGATAVRTGARTTLNAESRTRKDLS